MFLVLPREDNVDLSAPHRGRMRASPAANQKSNYLIKRRKRMITNVVIHTFQKPGDGNSGRAVVAFLDSTSSGWTYATTTSLSVLDELQVAFLLCGYNLSR